MVSRWEKDCLFADGTEQVNLTNNAAFDGNPAWSPDGKKIAFTSRRDEEESEIYVMDADGGNVRRLTRSPGYDEHPTWSPDGKKIAFHGEGDELLTNDIYVMNADGSHKKNLTHSGTMVYNREPDWCCYTLITIETPALTEAPSVTETPALTEAPSVTETPSVGEWNYSYIVITIVILGAIILAVIFFRRK